jgi:hypothetical protein
VSNLEADRSLLQSIVDDEDIAEDVRVKFEDMLSRLDKTNRPLTDAQRGWATATRGGERYEAVEKYENLVSRGLVPRGREVVVNTGPKPLRPPGRA